MKLENKKQKVAPLPTFFIRVFRYLIFAMLLILFSITLGVAGYSYYGDLVFVDAFHMACMILTGMGPVVNLTTVGGKMFSSLYALYSGVAFLSITAVFFAPIIHRLLHILHVEDEERDH